MAARSWWWSRLLGGQTIPERGRQQDAVSLRRGGRQAGRHRGGVPVGVLRARLGQPGMFGWLGRSG
jgi:hypothetical protein